MSLPDFPVDESFLVTVLEYLSLVAGNRITQIGTGDITLSDRIVAKRDKDSCIYVHVWQRSDPDDLHDHPWDSCSVVLRGGYYEVTDQGRFWRPPGSVVFRKAEDRHRIEIGERWTCPCGWHGTADELHKYPWEACPDCGKAGGLLRDQHSKEPVSLFITGKERREWGFHTKDGFIVGREYRSVAAYRARRDE